MAWRTEGRDLIYDGWENGMGGSPFTGSMLIRQVNVVDSPGEAFVGYDLLNQYTPPDANTASEDAASDTISYTRATNTLTGLKAAIMTGTPVTLSAGFTPFTGFKTTNVYYAIFQSLNSTSGVIKLATTLANAQAGTNIDLTVTSAGLTVTPVGPDFSGFSGPTGQIAPYPAVFTDTTGTAYQYMGDSKGQIWYYIGVANSQTGWTLVFQGASLTVASVTAATDIITMSAGTTFATGTALTIAADVAGSLPSPLVAGTTYYAINVNATDFKLATTLANALAGTAINITTAGSGTIQISFAEGVYGLAGWNGYLFVFRNYQIDIMKISTGAWTIGWKTDLTAALSHRALVAQDNAIYFCNGNLVGSILLTSGATFDPTSATTYSYNTSALQLPTAENAISLTELGVNLLVGGIFNKVYPWNRLPTTFGTSYSYPILVPEQNIAEMITVNTTTYIFAGYRGRIYQTNGSSASLFKKLPDYTAGTIMPLFYWKCSATDRNQLLFSVEVYDNGGTVMNGRDSDAGLWAINLDTTVSSLGVSTTNSALRYLQVFSCGLNTGMTNMFGAFIMPIARSSSGGLSFVAGWTVRSSNVNYSGFDGFVGQNSSTTGGTPDGAYNVGAAQLLTELTRVGTTYTKKTFEQVEWTLSVPLADGEKVQVEARNEENANFVVVGSTTASGGSAQISDVYSVNFQGYVWLQLRVTLFSVAFNSSPSYVRLRDVRVR